LKHSDLGPYLGRFFVAAVVSTWYRISGQEQGVALLFEKYIDSDTSSDKLKGVPDSALFEDGLFFRSETQDEGQRIGVMMVYSFR
jgi:hypothetical protein